MVLITLTLASSVAILLIIILGYKWKKFRLFFDDETYTYFDIFFVVLYFLEQAIFIVLVFFYPEYNRLFVGFFALVVITTVSLQKIMMESRNKRIASHTSKQLQILRKMHAEYEAEITKLLNYIETIEKKSKLKNRSKKK